MNSFNPYLESTWTTTTVTSLKLFFWHMTGTKVNHLNELELFQARRKNRRAEGTRAHRKTSDYKEGRVTLMRIKDFLRENVVTSEQNVLIASDIYKRFAEVYGNPSDVEYNVLRRHCKKIILAQMPGASYGRHRMERGFRNVALK